MKEYCLKEAKINFDQVEKIVFYEKQLVSDQVVSIMSSVTRQQGSLRKRGYRISSVANFDQKLFRFLGLFHDDK